MGLTRSSLLTDLVRLGLRPGGVVMVHASVRSIGPVTGGVNVVLQALLDAVGPTGTLAAYVDFEPFYEDDDTAEVPVFDKRIAHAARDHGILHETIRTWPGALRSDHPDAGVAAIGPLAAWITTGHPFHYGYGPGTPFARILQANAQVLLLGAPLDTITLLHYAEHEARIPGKRIRRYRRLMPTPQGPQWTGFEEFDTADPVNSELPIDVFARIAADCLTTGQASAGPVGAASSYRFPAPELVRFGTLWLEQDFAPPPA
ncbi:MAG: aminoglycoside 3-N-acetyltransferase [Acidobacteriaceae bacterium]|nr:aminoglycoside 3-N-acetyltransferase [Acidobacteriaceae bacterium]